MNTGICEKCGTTIPLRTLEGEPRSDHTCKLCHPPKKSQGKKGIGGIFVHLLALVACAAAGFASCAYSGASNTNVEEAPPEPPVAGATLVNELILPEEVHFKNLWQVTFGGQNAEAYWSYSGNRLSLQKTEKRVGLDCDRIYVTGADGSLQGTGEIVSLRADMVFKAVGQTLVHDDLDASLSLEKGRIVVDADRKTSLGDVWAGGDCVLGGEDLTVTAVEDGKIAAESINAALSA